MEFFLIGGKILNNLQTGEIPKSNNPDEIIDRLYKPFFSDHNKLDKELREALTVLITSDGTDEDVKVQKISIFLYAIWKKYAHEQLADVLINFPKIEKILLGAKLSGNSRYRDHFVHMFNTYIFGSLIISELINGLKNMKSEDSNSISSLFKITSETDEFPFVNPYSVEHRILFVWTLMSSFHDVGVPIQNLNEIHTGLNQYFEKFGLHISELKIEQHTFVRMKFPEYLESLATYYECGFIPDSTSRYKLGNKCSDPFCSEKRTNRVFLNKIINNLHKYDHGIISAICLLRGVEDTFLSGKFYQTKFSQAEFSKRYEEYIFKQDIMRASLGIALHTLKIEKNDEKIDFDKFPFTFLLVLCDQIQEFYRKENVAIEGIIPLKDWPIPTIKIKQSPFKIIFEICVQYGNLNEKEEKYLLEEAQKFKKGKGGKIPENYKEVLYEIWEDIYNNLDKKLTCSNKNLVLHLSYKYKDEERMRTLFERK